MLIETSHDIFWLTISLCLALLSVISAWGLFYVVVIVRRAAKAFKTVEQIIENINETVVITKDKIEHSAAYISILADGVKKVMDIVKDSKSDKGKKKK